MWSHQCLSSERQFEALKRSNTRNSDITPPMHTVSDADVPSRHSAGCAGKLEKLRRGCRLLQCQRLGIGETGTLSPDTDKGTSSKRRQPGGEMKFCTDPNPTQTSHNVVATVPGDKAYSPLWLRVVYDSAACASVHNLDTALKAKVVPARVLIINCPIVSIEH
jgi:hypothetical protein